MNMRRLAAATLALATIAQAAGPVGAQAAQPPWLARLSSWLEAVNGHKPGTLDMSARLTGFMGEDDLYEARTDFISLVYVCKREVGRSRQPAPIVYKDTLIPFADLRQLLGLTDDEAANGNANRVLLRAAILHADVAMLVIPLLPGRIGCSARATLLVQDGNRVGAGCVGIHWTQGRLLLDAVRPDPDTERAVRLWYHATITYLLEAGDFANADLQIGHGRLLFPSDPAMLFEHGYYHEGFASPLIQTVAVESGADTRGARVHLDEAEDLYRRAIKENPKFVEARVHRGYVLGLLGRHRDAAEELRLAVSTAVGPQLRYYAELFLGLAEESLGNRAAARDRYGLASALYPQAQSPLLALTLLARQFGDRAGAQDAMRKMLALPPGRDVKADPWWLYYRWQNQGSEALFAELHAPFLDGSRQ
jgi:tetratricopeptide (TPR) repeat protein